MLDRLLLPLRQRSHCRLVQKLTDVLLFALLLRADERQKQLGRLCFLQ